MSDTIRCWRFAEIPNLMILPESESTNDVGRQLVERMLVDDSELVPTAILARRQTAGRGRAGRGWVSPPGESLTVSVIVPWPEGPGRVRVPVETGIALARGLSERWGVTIRLKWPNDLVIERKKVGGILVEARSGGEGGGYAVIGVGLNLTTSREAFDAAGLPDATSLHLAGVPEDALSIETAAHAVLTAIDGLLATPVDDLPAEFAAVTVHAAGDRLTLRDGAKVVEGRYEGVTADGFLKLTTDDGSETLLSGDVTEF
jgi:BirA family biotin operon repressor/biotin-[acetyl-CoA-carboxylase] ligase